MATEENSRSEILHRIQSAKGRASTGAAAISEWAAIPRRYKRAGLLSDEQVLERLEDRLRDYDANVSRTDDANVSRSIALRLTERGKQKIVIPAGFPKAWLPEGFQFVVDDGLAAAELDELDGVLTGATTAIAETGTVILQSVIGQGRRALTLVPDYHLCVVLRNDIVETVPEAMERLRETANLATTFISGPSATADIEMTRIKGVHGPRHFDVILVM